MLSAAGIGSGLDVDSIVSQLMTFERQPLVALQRQLTDIDAKVSAYGKLKSALSSFQTAMQDLIIHPYQRRSVQYQGQIDINTGITVKLLVQLDQMLTEDQRSHLLGRIESLAADCNRMLRVVTP